MGSRSLIGCMQKFMRSRFLQQPVNSLSIPFRFAPGIALFNRLHAKIHEVIVMRILFVCHGNICRSPMAEFVMRELVQQRGLSDSISVASAATSTEEIGNPVHPGTRKVLGAHGISTAGKCAVQLTAADVDAYDIFIGMDSQNIRNMHRILGKAGTDKIFTLLSFCGSNRDIDDPWYTGDFQKTYRDVTDGCRALLTYLVNQSSF